VLYEEIFAPRRIRWHQQVARALEDVHGRRLEEHAQELAEHYSQSVDPSDLTKAVQFAEMAGRRAMSVFDYGEALARFGQALKAQDILDPDDAGRECDLLLSTADALLSLDLRAEALDDTLPQAYELAETIHDSTRAFRACRIALDCLIGEIREDTPLWHERAATHVGDDRRGQIRLLRAKAGYLLQAGYALDAANSLRDVLTIARDLDDANEIVGVTWLLLNGVELEASEVVSLINEANRRSNESVSTLNRLAFAASSAMALLSVGNRKDAESFVENLKGIANSSRHVRAAGLSAFQEGVMEFLDGRFDFVRTSGHDTLPVLNFRIAHYLGSPDETESLPHRPVHLRSLLPWLLEISRLFHNGDRMGASDSWRPLRGRLFEERHRMGQLNLAQMLEVALLLEDREAVKASLEGLQAYQSSRRYFIRTILICCLPLLLGKATAFLGQQTVGRQSYEAAVDFCAEMGDRPELALSHLGLAELLLDHFPDEHNAAIEHLDFAIAEFRDMKMQPALERALGRRGLLKA
jgi:hypothetical protein